ncbi:MAG: competence/damage-inducible protein A [Hyphomicrobiales bacterium]|nr:competence/damage-inducible protein A [Hyphomicrobiales bacterium]
MTQPTLVSAAMIAIGDELLSGRTQDKNIAHLARFLNVKGIDLAEVRIVADDSQAIVEAVNTLRSQHDYLFTSGGIGPTHDDITTEAIAKAFGVQVITHKQAYSRLASHYHSRNIEFTPARQKMAQTPENAILIDNAVSVAPGYIIQNVYVMAGVPAVFNAMILSVEPQLQGGAILLSASIDCPHGEGTIGGELTLIAKQNPHVSIGSYPRFDQQTYSTQIVMRSHSQDALDEAEKNVELMLVKIQRNESK